mgnify:CR=1 FL=1
MTPSKLSAINKLLTPYLEFLENKKRVNKFEELEELTTILNDVTLDYKELLKQVKQTINTGTVEPVITPETKKSDSDTEESASESEESEKEPVQVKQQTFKKRLLPATKTPSQLSNPSQPSQPVKKSKRLPGL